MLCRFLYGFIVCYYTMCWVFAGWFGCLVLRFRLGLFIVVVFGLFLLLLCFLLCVVLFIVNIFVIYACEFACLRALLIVWLVSLVL